MNYGNTLLERIRTLAKEQGMSISKLEDSLGFGNGTISRWDKSSPSVEKLQAVGKALNVSIAFLLGNVFYPNSPVIYPYEEIKKDDLTKADPDLKDILQNAEVMFDGLKYPLTDDKKLLLAQVIKSVLKDDGK